MDRRLSERADYATELSGELMATLWESFMAIFQSIWYRRSGWLKKEYFEEVQMKNLKIHACKHPEVSEYIDMCCKKLAVLLSSNALEGFQMNMIGPEGIVQRFVFCVSGKLDYSGFDRAQGEQLLREISTATQQGIRRFFEKEKTMKVIPLRKFQIVLGLTGAAVKTYETFTNGVMGLDTDPDFFCFPWSKPRTKELVPQTLIIKSNYDETDSTPIPPPHVSVKENSPSPEPMDTNIRKEFVSDEEASSVFGTVKPDMADTELKTKSPLLIPVQNQTYTNPDVIPIHSMRFGGSMSISMGFYSVTYKKDESKIQTPITNPATNLGSAFSPNNINSPGQYRSINRNQSPRNISDYFTRKDSPSISIRTPVNMDRELLKSDHTSPTSSTPPSFRVQRSAESARSLKAQFEEAFRNEAQSQSRSRQIPNVSVSPRNLTPVTLPPLRRIRTPRRRT